MASHGIVGTSLRRFPLGQCRHSFIDLPQEGVLDENGSDVPDGDADGPGGDRRWRHHEAGYGRCEDFGRKVDASQQCRHGWNPGSRCTKIYDGPTWDNPELRDFYWLLNRLTEITTNGNYVIKWRNTPVWRRDNTYMSTMPSRRTSQRSNRVRSRSVARRSLGQRRWPNRWLAPGPLARMTSRWRHRRRSTTWRLWRPSSRRRFEWSANALRLVEQNITKYWHMRGAVSVRACVCACVCECAHMSAGACEQVLLNPYKNIACLLYDYACAPMHCHSTTQWRIKATL